MVAGQLRRTPPTLRLPLDVAPWVVVAGAVALLVGIALRAWMLATHVSPTESDEAVLALMALRISRGELHLMYWGQPYGGPVESFVAAPLLWVVGPSVLVTKLVGAGLALGSAVLIWRIGRRTVGEAAGILAAALFWMWPPYFVFYSTKMSIYFGSLFLALLDVLLLVRLADGDRRRWLAPAAGLVAGLAFWASPQTLFLLLPVGAALLPRLLPQWRRLLVAVPCAVVGAAPWLAFNAMNGWVSLQSVPVEREVTYLSRVIGVAPQVPLALGLRTFGTERWLVEPLALTLLAVLGLALLSVLVRRPPRWTFLAVAVCLFPLAYAMSPLSVYSRGGSPRYFLAAIPLIALLLGRALAWAGERIHPALVAVGLAVALAITGVGLRDLAEHRLGWFPGAPDALVPAEFGDLRALLREHDVDHAYADYWISFRATFETGEDTIVAPVQPWLDRYPPYSEEVAASPRPAAFITLQASAVTGRVEAELQELGIGYRRWERGAFVVFQPDTTVGRDSLSAAYQLQP